jgi:iron-sulfur cluster assembly protein
MKMEAIHTNLMPASMPPPPPAEGDASPESRLTFTVSVEAARAIRRQLDKRGTPDSSLRVGIRGGGCSGFSYVIEFHDGEPHARDRVIEIEGVRVVIDPKSLVYLAGAELHWEKTLMRQGFKFVNPNEKTNCGCGHSFTV